MIFVWTNLQTILLFIMIVFILFFVITIFADGDDNVLNGYAIIILTFLCLLLVTGFHTFSNAITKYKKLLDKSTEYNLSIEEINKKMNNTTTEEEYDVLFVEFFNLCKKRDSNDKKLNAYSISLKKEIKKHKTEYIEYNKVYNNVEEYNNEITNIYIETF